MNCYSQYFTFVGGPEGMPPEPSAPKFETIPGYENVGGEEGGTDFQSKIKILKRFLFDISL